MLLMKFGYDDVGHRTKNKYSVHSEVKQHPQDAILRAIKAKQSLFVFKSCRPNKLCSCMFTYL